MRVSLLLGLLCASLPALAQPAPGTCTFGTAQADLNANDVRARVFNTGSLFFGNQTDDGTGYLVPKASGNSPVFASGLWVGGRVNGELRVAAARYADFNFWPGPLADDGRPVDPSDCSAYDRIYSVSRSDIAATAAGNPVQDVVEWPAALGAPVVDGDGVAGNYDFAAGDRPGIVADQALFWVMNDVGGPHAVVGTPPLGIEVRVLAFAYNRADALGQTTFYRYTIVNKSPNDITDAYVSVFADPDLGNPEDDYVGSDPASGLGYSVTL